MLRILCKPVCFGDYNYLKTFSKPRKIYKIVAHDLQSEKFKCYLELFLFIDIKGTPFGDSFHKLLNNDSIVDSCISWADFNVIITKIIV